MRYKKAYQKFIALIVASLLVCLFVVPEYKSLAKDSFVSEFIQKVFNQSNGIGSNEVKCIYQSSSGYIWVGTDGGLYRTSGADFQSISLWDTERTDIYSINCITQDSEGRMWFGTDNYGLFYMEKGQIYHLQNDYYEGIKAITGICEYKDGTMFVATNKGIYYVSFSENNVAKLTPHPATRLAGGRFRSIHYLDGKIWIQRGDSDIYILDSERVIDVIDLSEISQDNIQSIEIIEDKVCVGTTGNEVIFLKDKDHYETLHTTIDGINGFMKDGADRLWVCADNGVGYFDTNGYFFKINDLKIDNYMSDMIIDYEGNYWFTSTKMGVLLLSRSKFSDFNLKIGMPEEIVNCVYVNDKYKYICTDDGLRIYDIDNNKIENELTELLGATGIRHMCKDLYGNLWIATARRYGVVRVSPDGTINTIKRIDGLPSMSVDYIKPINGGNVAIATEDGLAIADSQGNILKTYGSEEGLPEVYINCIYYMDDMVLLGTDGKGIVSIDMNNDTINIYTTSEGLNSDVVTSIVEGTDGLFIGTDNGLCFYNDTFRAISSIDYSNGIYDLLKYDDEVWIIGSKGIIHASEEELLGNTNISGRYFDRNDGLNKTLNTTGKSAIDSNGRMYICCDTGLYILNIDNIPYNIVEPKINVTSVDVDGIEYEIDDLADGLVIGSDTTRITVRFSVFSYANRDNIKVQYYLKGFDENPIVISGSDRMEAVYTNLDGGTYEFTISAVNADGVESGNIVSFEIKKNRSFFETSTAKVLLIVTIILFIIGAIHSAIRVKRIVVSKTKALEELSKEHEEAIKSSSAKNDYLANMSNEIKTPINIMMVKAEELLNIMAEDAPYREDIETIYSAGNSIIEKVDDIILLAKIEAGRIETVKQTYSLSDIMFELSEFAAQKIADKPIKFFVEIGEEIEEEIIGDGEKIKDILKRLLDNAVKFTREGSITLSVDCYDFVDKNHHGMINLVFTVADTGTGIPEDKLQDVFTLYNTDENKKSTYTAEGVGLAIAKGYTELIDGELQVDSVYGGGTTFTLSVNQKTLEHSARSRIIAKIDEMVSKEDVDKLWLPDVKVLVVDDDDQSLEITEKLLSKFETKTDTAKTGFDAIDMIMNNNYDVVLLDLTLPVMNGEEIMKEIREIDSDGFSTLPIISMDTDAIDKNRDKLLEDGFTDNLVKPIDIRRLAAILKDCLPMSKILEKSTSISEFIQESKFSDGLYFLQDYLDVEGIIEKIGGNIEVFNKLVRNFYNQNRDVVEELDDMYEEDIRGFKGKIHNIKTGSTSIGAYKISQEATRIEAAINIGNKDYTNEKLDKFIFQLEEMIQVIGEYLEFVDEITSGVESIGQITPEKFNEILSNMKTENDIPYDGDRITYDDSEEITLATDEDLDIDLTESPTVAVDESMLEDIKYAALDGDFNMAREYLEIIAALNLPNEDTALLVAISDAIDTSDAATIDQLITDYIDSKQA